MQDQRRTSSHNPMVPATPAEVFETVSLGPISLKDTGYRFIPDNPKQTGHSS